MKKLIVFCSMIYSSTLFSQTECGTVMDSTTRTWFDNWEQARQNGTSVATTTLYVPVHIHLVGDDNGNGYMNKADAYTLICEINQRYAPMNIVCFLDGPITYIDSTVYYNHTFPYGQQMITLKNVPNVCNIYVVDYAAGNCGYSFYPNSGPAGGKGGIVLKKSCALPGNTTLAHEMGHYFTLPHTFQDWNTPNAEYADGSNCSTKGDKFCDTPADFQDFRWYCPYAGTQLDPQGQAYTPDGSLYMSYSREPCATRFSPMQQSAIIYSRTNDRPYLDLIPVPSFNPVTPANLLAPPNNDTTIHANGTTYFVWNKVSGAIDYNFRIKHAADPGFNNSFINVFTTDTFYFASGFIADSTYNWKVIPLRVDATCMNVDSSIHQQYNFKADNLIGIYEALPISTINIYPNPSAAELNVNIELLQNEYVTIEIKSLQGKALFQQSYILSKGFHKITLPVTSIANGMYQVNIYSNEFKTAHKWIKSEQ